jgi:8-oxo-dGTP diphosphatase
MEKKITLAVDAILPFKGKIVLIKRKYPPYKGLYALPGGMVKYGEEVESAVLREVREEVGVDGKVFKLVGVYSSPARDPRGHVVSICYIVLPTSENLRAGSDAKEVELFPLDALPDLAFDHKKMIQDAKEDLYGILSQM